MNEKERNVLKKASESNEGLISPAVMINSFSGTNRKIPENLFLLVI